MYSTNPQSTCTNASRNTYSMNSGNTSCSQEIPLNHQRDNLENGEKFYMYGDTKKTLILDGVQEIEQNLEELMIRCAREIGIPLTPADIDSSYRIGKYNPKKDRPRPVKITLKDQTKRDQIFIFKARLRFSEDLKNIRINREERRDNRIKIAKLRQAGETARKMGYRVETGVGRIRIDGVEYNTFTLDTIPDIFMREANEVRTPPVNTRRLTLAQKCTTKSTRVIMVGPALQKTPTGLAFYSEACFLSNFHPSKFYFRGQPYTSLEQGYQCTKAKVYQDERAFESILGAQTPALMKAIGREIVVNEKWDTLKLQVMTDLLLAKFRQNKHLYYSLLNTRPLNLIEATLDGYWGAGCTLGSVALEEECWTGQNQLGRLLVQVRALLVRELEIAQGSIK